MVVIPMLGLEFALLFVALDIQIYQPIKDGIET